MSANYSYRFLIIGSSGFIGSHFVSSLTDDTFFYIDSREAFASLLRSREKLSFENVVWLAGSTRTTSLRLDSVDSAQDVIDLKRFLDMFNGRFKRFIFLSSGGCVYGPGSGHFDENTPPHPINWYGEVKLRCERLLNEYSAISVVLRVANVIGVNSSPRPGQGIITHWIQSVKENLPVTIYGSLDSYRDYIDVDSLIDAITMSLHTTKSNTINIGSGSGTSIKMLLEYFSKAIGRHLDISHHLARATDRFGYTLNVARANHELGWVLRRPIGDTIESLVKNELS